MTTESLVADPSSNDEFSVLGSRQAWVVCISAALFFFYEFIQMQMFNAINGQLRSDFAVDASALGLLSSTYLIADMLVLIPAGFILDRISSRKVIIAAMILGVSGTLGFALSHSLVAAGIFHAISGAGQSFCFLSAYVLVSRWFPARQHAFVIGVVVTMAFIGGMIAQTPLAILAENVGWRQALLYDVILGMTVIGIIYWNVKDYPAELASHCEAEMANNRKTPLLSSLVEAGRNSQNWLTALYTALLNLPIMVLTAVWGSPYLQRVHHLDNRHATLVTMMIFVGSIIGCPLIGWWSDHIGKRKQPMIIGGVLSLATIGLLMVMPSLSFMQLMLIFFALGLFTSAQIITYPVIAESNPSHINGIACGLAATVIMGMGMFAQPIFGWILDSHWTGQLLNHTRIYNAHAYETAMLMFPVTFIIGLIAVGLAREPGE